MAERHPTPLFGACVENKELVVVVRRPLWRQRRFNASMLTGICKDCKYGLICRGGCSEKALSFIGTPYGSPYCLYDIEKRL